MAENPLMTLPQQLYKDPEQGMILGVCAGLANYFQVNVIVVRLIFMIPFVPIWLVYFFMALILEEKPKNSISPEHTFETALKAIHARLQHSERRIIQLEAFVTSDEFEFKRKLWQLEHE